MRLKSLFFMLLTPVIGMAAEISTDPSTLSDDMTKAADGDVLLLQEGTYAGTLTFPAGKTITLKAARDAAVTFGCVFRCTDASQTDGGLVMDGLKVACADNYFIDVAYGNMKTLSLKNCDISGIGRCLLRTNNTGSTIDEIAIDNCIIHGCGANGYCFIYPKHGVKKLSITNSTLYNYKNGESLFAPNATTATIDFQFNFQHNTVYRWSKASKYALCSTGAKMSTFSTFNISDNIIYKAGVDGQLPSIIDVAGGYLDARKNLVVDYGTYKQASAAQQTINDCTLAALGLTALTFPDPDNGDFSIASTSPLATAATDGGVIGDGRWLKTLHAAVHLSTANMPSEGGAVSPVAADYNSGDSVTVTATSNYGYRFKEWQDKDGTVISDANPLRLKMTSDTLLTAVYGALDMYTLTVNKAGDGALWGNVKLSPEPVNGKYECGEVVTMKVVPNSITSFLYWEDNCSESQRMVTMDGDKSFTATFDVVPFIVAWDFAVSEPRGERKGDYFAETSNTGLLSLYNADGSSTNWGGSTRTFGGVERNCIRRYTDYDKMGSPRSFVARFSAAGYKNIRIHSYAAADNNCVHKVQKMQFSLNGADYADIDTLNMDATTQNTWMAFDAALPDTLGDASKNMIYIRWIGDATSPLVGDCKSGDSEGFYLADIVVFADKETVADTEAPLLVSTSPAANSDVASAAGKLSLTFDEKIKLGSGDVTLNGVALEPLLGSRTVSYAYSNVGYGKVCKVIIPKGALTDMSGNPYAGSEFSFTTMQRPHPAKKVFDAVVAADGTGDYTTVQAAVNAVPENRTFPYLIFVKNGVYDELVKIPVTKPFVHLIGQDKEKTVICHKINNGSSSDVGYEYSTNNPSSANYGYQAVVEVDATDFYTENITYLNSYGVDSQSGPMDLAMRSNNDRMAFYNCKFRSYQDTWFTSTKNVSDRHYIKDCWIEGAVDYFYGGGDVFLDSCTMYNVRSGSVITAPCHKSGTMYGYVFSNCIVDGNKLAADGKQALGRPWQNAPKCVYINTTMKIDIQPSGWNNMGTVPALFAEYNSMDVNGNPIDLSSRRTEYSYTDRNTKEIVTGTCRATITAEEAAAYSYENVTKGSDDWNPRKYFEDADAPAGVELNADSKSLTWKASDYAICYVVIDGNDKVVGITDKTEFIGVDASMSYTVKAVNEYGSLSRGAKSTVLTGVTTAKDADVAKISYYNAAGEKLNGMQKGVNIVRYELNDGSVRALKKMK